MGGDAAVLILESMDLRTTQRTHVHGRSRRASSDPGLQALDLRITSAAPPPLHTAYAALDTVIQDFTREAKLTA